MSSQPIYESGMVFGPYPEGQCFYIEKSQCYNRIATDVPMAEFLLLKRKENGLHSLWIVEAKSSVPRESDAYFNEIRSKLINGLMLGVSMCLKKHPETEEELPQAFQKLDLKTTGFQLVLVIPNVPKKHLPPLNEKLAKTLKPFINIWGISTRSVTVLNDDGAKTCGLILPTSESITP